MKYRVTLNGKTYEVEVEHGKAILLDEYEALAPAKPAPSVQTAPATSQAQTQAQNAPAPVQITSGEPVNAPFPGNIIRVDVKQGDSVKAGQILVILEAMKMENEITAPKDGTVVQVVVEKGAVVSSGDTLVVMD